MAKAKKGKLSKRLRKGARWVASSKMVRDILEDLISAALIAAAVRLRDSGALERAAEAAKAKAAAARAKAGDVAQAAGEAVAAKSGGRAKTRAARGRKR